MNDDGSGIGRKPFALSVTLLKLRGVPPPPEAGVPVMISPLNVPAVTCQLVEADGAKSVPLIVEELLTPVLIDGPIR